MVELNSRDIIVLALSLILVISILLLGTLLMLNIMTFDLTLSEIYTIYEGSIVTTETMWGKILTYDTMAIMSNLLVASSMFFAGVCFYLRREKRE
ncbi:MAG: hypothetical protein ACFFB5_11800 [Promethearchaeota archaeon]